MNEFKKCVHGPCQVFPRAYGFQTWQKQVAIIDFRGTNHRHFLIRHRWFRSGLLCGVPCCARGWSCGNKPPHFGPTCGKRRTEIGVPQASVGSNHTATQSPVLSPGRSEARRVPKSRPRTGHAAELVANGDGLMRSVMQGRPWARQSQSPAQPEWNPVQKMWR